MKRDVARTINGTIGATLHKVNYTTKRGINSRIGIAHEGVNVVTVTNMHNGFVYRISKDKIVSIEKVE